MEKIEKMTGMEQRLHKRRHLIYYLRVFDGASSRVVGYLADITVKGMMLVCEEPVAVQEEYRLRMKFPEQIGGRDELFITAVCRWCREDVNPSFYIAGFQIDDLAPAERRFITCLINDFGFQDG